jgi:hypothetical protein
LNDVVSVGQEFHDCETRSEFFDYLVSQELPPPPAILRPVCEGDRIVRVGGLIKGAVVELRADGEDLVRGGAADATTPTGVPPLMGLSKLEARQSLCDGADGTWSEWSACPIRPLGPAEEPQIVAPLSEGGVAIGVMNLEKGTFVQVIGRKGVLGEGWGNGDERVDIPLWFSLIAGDNIHLRTLRCGDKHDWLRTMRVHARRDVWTPKVADPACDCGASLLVRNVLAGAIVETFLVDPNGLPTFLGAARAGADSVSVDVPPLDAGDRVHARQRLGQFRSGPGPEGIAPLRPVWNYVANSAFRLCQLTQDWDPTNRPHGVATSPIGITGTDLGIPIEYEGVLYFFFGDSAEAPDSEPDGDPIAWTTDDDVDEFEDHALDLHWIVGPTGSSGA